MNKSILNKLTNSINNFRINSKLSINKDFLFLEPTNELLRGYCINKSGLNKMQFELRYFVFPLYKPSETIKLTFGGTILNNKRQWWELNEENGEVIAKEIASKMVDVENSFFAKIYDSLSFLNYYYKDRKINFRYYEAIALSACYSKQKNRIEILKDLKSFCSNRENVNNPFAKKIISNIELLLQSENMQTFLNLWMDENRKRIGIE
ncbi:hypothetical protein EGI22_12615 [Lacihabitans sp. LS3-19]|uniref:hypothetical protein n=1 Tax=Lacihabitans sp. LS3-19 TaxID=2487335 RepID=UPI0020CE3ADB|nr:hypothetical protein [Lacihabitans sp. LS3-19]MCP9768761.1 hypothetical protein [Lacihabitans sp. LS3-19]